MHDYCKQRKQSTGAAGQQKSLVAMMFGPVDEEARCRLDEEESSASEPYHAACLGHPALSLEEDDTTINERGIADNNFELILNSQFVGTPTARAANENENMQIDDKCTDKNIEKNIFRTSDSSDFGSHSQIAAAQDAPAEEPQKDAAFVSDDRGTKQKEEGDPAVLLATSILSSVVSKCNSLSDNSDNAATPFAPGKNEEAGGPQSPLRKRVQRKKPAKVPVVASVNRRKRASTRSDTDVEMTSDEIDEKAVPPAHLGLSQSSKKAFKKRGQQSTKAKNEAQPQKRKSPMYVQLDEKDNN